jgi:hypothetical protein
MVHNPSIAGDTPLWSRSCVDPLMAIATKVSPAPVQQHHQFAHEHRIELGRVLAGVTDRYPPYITSSLRPLTSSARWPAAAPVPA